MSVRGRPISFWLLLLLLGQLSVRALAGGTALLVSPSGELVGLPTGPLNNAPIENFLLPGLALFLVFGLGSSVVCYGLYTRRRWAWSGAIGVALALRYTIYIVFGQRTRGLTDAQSVPELALGSGFELGGHEVTLVVIAAGLMLGVHLLLQTTKLGKAMRAMADNEDLARVTGIPTERVVRFTWIIGGGLAGAGGYLIALERGAMNFQFGWILLLLIFAAVILGGIGSIYGAMFGGVTIGITQSISLVWLPSEFSTVAAFGVMIFVLLFKPDGLFSGVTTA